MKGLFSGGAGISIVRDCYGQHIGFAEFQETSNPSFNLMVMVADSASGPAEFWGFRLGQGQYTINICSEPMNH